MYQTVTVNDKPRVLNLRTPILDMRDLTYRSMCRTGPILKTADWSYPEFRIRDQLGGTCCGNAFVGLIDAMTKGKQLLSATHAYMAGAVNDGYESTFPGCDEDGTLLRAVLKSALKRGIVPEELWPHLRGIHPETGQEYGLIGFRGGSDLLQARGEKILRYTNLSNDKLLMKAWLSTRGPIYCGLQIDEAFCEHRKGEFLYDYDRDAVCGGHAVFVWKFFNTVTAFEGVELPELLFPETLYVGVNSWGSQYGWDGQFVMTEDYFLDACMEVWGIEIA